MATTDQLGRWLAYVVVSAIAIVFLCGALALGLWLIRLVI
jgi:hypothetical protein